MILDLLKSWDGEIEINNQRYRSVQDVPGNIAKIKSIKLCREQKNEARTILASPGDKKLYHISVKNYMTLPATPNFDFMSHWNNNEPMPLRTMVGYIERETKGMIYANLWGDIVGRTQYCMKCGKELTNPVSVWFGIGPECGNHNYVNPFDSEEELQSAVQSYRTNYLNKIQWQGWILKSAIEELREVNGV